MMEGTAADTDDEGYSGRYRLQMVKRIVADTDDEGNSGRYRLQIMKEIEANTDDKGNSGTLSVADTDGTGNSHAEIAVKGRTQQLRLLLTIAASVDDETVVI